MKSKLVVTVAVLSLFANIAAEAATLTPGGGTVFTRTGGQGFHRVPNLTSTEVQPGDTVMAAMDGSAQIVLSDGKVITVGPGQVVVVPQSSSPDGTQPGGIDPTYVVIGAAAAAGIGVGIYYATKGSSTTPAPVSP